LNQSDFESASPVLTRDIVAKTFDLKLAMSARKAIGAPSPDNVAREIQRWSEHLS